METVSLENAAVMEIGKGLTVVSEHAKKIAHFKDIAIMGLVCVMKVLLN